MRAGEAGVDIGAGVDQEADRCGPVRVVARPVGHDMEQRACHLTVVLVAGGAKCGGGQLRVVSEQSLHRVDVAVVNRRDRGHSTGIIGGDGHGQGLSASSDMAATSAQVSAPIAAAFARSATVARNEVGVDALVEVLDRAEEVGAGAELGHEVVARR